MIELFVAFVLYHSDAPLIFWVAYCLVLFIQLVKAVLESVSGK